MNDKNNNEQVIQLCEKLVRVLEKKCFLRLSDKVERFATFEEAKARKTYFDCEMIVDTSADELWVAWADDNWQRSNDASLAAETAYQIDYNKVCVERDELRDQLYELRDLLYLMVAAYGRVNSGDPALCDRFDKALGTETPPALRQEHDAWHATAARIRLLRDALEHVRPLVETVAADSENDGPEEHAVHAETLRVLNNALARTAP